MIAAANDKKADVKTACRLFRTYIATEAKMLNALEAHGRQCGVPKRTNQQVRSNHARAQQIGKQLCDAAARGSPLLVPALRDLYDAPPVDHDPPPIIKDDMRLPPKPVPWREPWPTRITERQ